MVGPFIFWDHMGPAKISPNNSLNVLPHPHIGLATITWLFSGEIVHRDSLGHEQSIRPGEVNWMTAGEGIAHSERCEPKDKSFELEGIQLWLALPKEYEEVAPSFYHCKDSLVPRLNVDGTQLRLIAGEFLGKKSPVPVYSNLFYLYGITKKQHHLKLAVQPNHELAVYILKGSVEIEATSYQRFDLIDFKQSCPLELLATEDAELMILGGEVFPEKRHMWWNFVSTSKDKIEAAKVKWKTGLFPPVINETEFIPLPE